MIRQAPLMLLALAGCRPADPPSPPEIPETLKRFFMGPESWKLEAILRDPAVNPTGARVVIDPDAQDTWDYLSNQAKSLMSDVVNERTEWCRQHPELGKPVKRLEDMRKGERNAHSYFVNARGLTEEDALKSASYWRQSPIWVNGLAYTSDMYGHVASDKWNELDDIREMLARMALHCAASQVPTQALQWLRED